MLISFIIKILRNQSKDFIPVWNYRYQIFFEFGIFFVIVPLLFTQTTTVRATSNMSSPEQVSALNEFSQKSSQFAVKLLNFMYQKDPNINIIYSPFSIETCVVMARIGATGETAAELDRLLGLPANDITAIGDTFHNILSLYKDRSIIKIANKIYVMQGYKIRKEFNEIASNKFFSSADSIDFGESAAAANTINTWIESKTNNLIKDLVSPSAVDSSTRVVLVNAIHFKGEWKYQFSKSVTRDDDFYLNEVDSVKVPMMNIKQTFSYGVIPELNATALEMPYKDTDLSMLVILPNSRTGLTDLQENLKSFDTSQITRTMSPTKVIVKFPKFKAEYNIELNDALKNLGMGRMFSRNAELDKMLDSSEPLQISRVVHKAFIEVNEEGTEAAAATCVTVRQKRSIMSCSQIPEFHADHPFIYHIRQIIHGDSSTSVPLFIGVISNVTVVVPFAQHDEF